MTTREDAWNEGYVEGFGQGCGYQLEPHEAIGNPYAGTGRQERIDRANEALRDFLDACAENDWLFLWLCHHQPDLMARFKKAFQL